MLTTRFLYFFLICFIGLQLVACGGKTAMSRLPPPNVQPPPLLEPNPDSEPGPYSLVDTQEFRNNWGLGLINAIPAYEEGGTGEGVTVAVIDGGFNLTHSDLSSVFHPNSKSVIGGFDVDVNPNNNYHGTLVFRCYCLPTRTTMVCMGSVYDAQVLAIHALTCDNGDCGFSDSDLATAIDVAVAEVAKVINLSLAGGANSPELTNAYRRSAEAGVLIVTFTGNGDEDTCPARARS